MLVFFLKITLIVSAVVVPFSLYSRKFANPNKLIFLFGKKGSGKSTYMVKLMLKHIKLGWTVYTNMEDVNIPGVRIFDAMALKTMVPEPHSVLFVDEAGLLWDNRGYKSFDKGLTEFFKLQRKYKCKLIINSQSFDVDKKIRDLTDSMMLQTNIGNVIGITRPILRSITLTEPTGDKDSRIADRLQFAKLWHWKFTWLPRYFQYFDSYEAPVRPFLPYRVVGEAMKELKQTSPRKAIQLSLNKENENEDHTESYNTSEG